MQPGDLPALPRARSPGAPRTSSRRSARTTAATARTRTVSSTTSSTRSSSSRRREDVLDQYLGSLEALGIDLRQHDVRFVEDDWEEPTLGAWGLGWEVWMRRAWRSPSSRTSSRSAGSTSTLVPAEITYGLERLAMFLQGKRSAFDLEWAPGHHLGRRLPARTSASGRSTTSSWRRSRSSCAASASTRSSAGT